VLKNDLKFESKISCIKSICRSGFGSKIFAFRIFEPINQHGHPYFIYKPIAAVKLSIVIKDKRV